MSGSRRLWLSHLIDDPQGVAAHEQAAALGPVIHDVLLAAGDRLANVSAMVAQQYYRHAAAAWRVFGPAGFHRWLVLGEDAAAAAPAGREGALGFFAVFPADFGSGELDAAAAWCRLGLGLAEVSPKLGGMFFQRTAAVLRQPGGITRLQRWVEGGRNLHRQYGRHGEFLAQAYCASAPQSVVALCPDAYQLWAGTGAALYPAAKDREFFGSLPSGLQQWTDTEQVLFLRTTLILATASSKHACVFYRELPLSITQLDLPVRKLLLQVLARAAKQITAAIAEIASTVGALIQQIPALHRVEALKLVDALATRNPLAVVAALKALPRAYDQVPPLRVREWFRHGFAVADDNALAGQAYFALESRTSLRVLHAASTAADLEEVCGLLRKYIQMLSGLPVSLRFLEHFCLRPPLEEFPIENEVALPARIDLLPSYEDNLRLYRFLAAQLSGRREFGTYDFAPPNVPADDVVSAGGALIRLLTAPGQPVELEELFLLTEGIRVHSRLRASYRGLADEGKWLAVRLLDRWCREPTPRRGQGLDALFAAVLLESDCHQLPAWLSRSSVDVVRRLVAPLARADATVEDSLRVAQELANALTMIVPLVGARGTQADEFGTDNVIGEVADQNGDDNVRVASRKIDDHVAEDQRPATSEELQNRLERETADGLRAGPIAPEESKRLLEAGAELHIAQGGGVESDGVGIYLVDLIGRIPSEQLNALRQLIGDPDSGPRHPPTRWVDRPLHPACFWYDEWDYHIADYRRHWCRLHERGLEGDSGEFFATVLADYARLIPEVRRQFQRIRPESYRTVKGLEDGVDFDLNAVIEARIDARAGLVPSERLYVARRREERDVATLFLVDMSASTDEPLVRPGAADRSPATAQPTAVSDGLRVRRVIDVTKETLVIMAEALEEIGDAYAVYGFSGHGRENVEVYRVKSFTECLSAAVKARLGGIEPKRSTRMGTALRHAVEKMAAINARCKYLFLLSDGFPQDYDYGQDRRSNVYAIRDTAAALREVKAEGVTPFCITVDKAGHDYLRQMCDESHYMVIEDITALPRELPKIYQRVVRA